MKTTNFLRTALMMAILASGSAVFAQGRGHEKNNDHRYDNNNKRKYQHGHYHDRDFDHHHAYHHHAPIVERRVVYHYNQPRYVYYRDYDVYFDNGRNVYISYSGRNWTMSSSLPICMNRVDVRRANRTSVNYFNDDFQQRLEIRRAGGRMYSDW